MRLTVIGRAGYYSLVSKQALLDEIVAARTDLSVVLHGLTPDHFLISGVSGIWSIKDILAHLVAWESETVTAFNQAQNSKIPALLRIDDIDSWNDEQYHINIRRPLSAILDDFEGVHKMILQMVRDYDTRALLDNRRFSWMEGEPLAYLIDENVILHEREHAYQIRAWRDSQAL
jgi:hypothetical protein